MNAVTPVVKPVSHMQLAASSILTIPNVSWQKFEMILQELGEHRRAKVAYSQGTLEIMVPLAEHEIEIIPNLVERAWQVGSFQALEEFEETLTKERSEIA